ncbi:MULTISPECIES: hypothetical protein [unclassified Avibacterium]|uniref:hypothetical protein n=1 Tax=unclassified Avibacterium TaxID=2685287 RepID=UPI00218BD659|nr:hypothetical protein [Avibacterium sp. 20-129]MCW9698866.1 hypothetical protein [Avibacterium sp. 20-129]URL01794.1 hypothetical protein L4F91_09835 [Avibacterium sp. 20-126]
MELIQLFTSSLNKGEYFTTIIITLIGLILLFRPLFEYFLILREMKFKDLDYAISILDKERYPDLERFLKEQQLEWILYRLTKIRGNLNFLRKFIAFHNFIQKKYTFNQVAKSAKYFKLQEGSLVLSIKKAEKFDVCINVLYFFILTFFGIYFIYYGFSNLEHNLKNAAIILFTGFFYFFISLFFALQVQPYLIALKLKRDLEQFNLTQEAITKLR